MTPEFKILCQLCQPPGPDHSARRAAPLVYFSADGIASVERHWRCCRIPWPLIWISINPPAKQWLMALCSDMVIARRGYRREALRAIADTQALEARRHLPPAIVRALQVMHPMRLK